MQAQVFLMIATRRLTALMGPSGSGKTTLLNTLAGQLPVSKHVTLEGELTVNGEHASAGLHRQAYVQQEVGEGFLHLVRRSQS